MEIEDKIISLRLTKEQYGELERLALVNNCSVEQVLIQSAFGNARKMPDARRQLFSEFSAFGSELGALYSQIREKGLCDAERLEALLADAGRLLDAAWDHLGLARDYRLSD